ncbi:MAG: hypothetical protein WAN10_04120 [Candidatus Acidiferrales bacterium]
MEILIGRSESVEISFFDNEYEYTSLAEIDENHARIQQIEIRTHKPYSRVTLGKERLTRFFFRDKNTVYVSDDEGAEFLFFKVCEVLTRRQRVLPLFFKWWIFALSVALNLCTAYVPWRSSLTVHFGRYALIVIEWFTAIYQLVFLYLMFQGMSLVRLESPHPQGPFWARNGDKIKLLIIGTIIGIIGTVVTRYLGHLVVK